MLYFSWSFLFIFRCLSLWLYVFLLQNKECSLCVMLWIIGNIQLKSTLGNRCVADEFSDCCWAPLCQREGRYLYGQRVNCLLMVVCVLKKKKLLKVFFSWTSTLENRNSLYSTVCSYSVRLNSAKSPRIQYKSWQNRKAWTSTKRPH